MREAIQAAQKSIYWELYIFYDDAPTHRFLDLLKERARAGVKVKIILDSLGSFQFFGNLQADLKSHGIELLYFNRLLPWWNPHRGDIGGGLLKILLREGGITRAEGESA